jgi:hypothetical protein
LSFTCRKKGALTPRQVTGFSFIILNKWSRQSRTKDKSKKENKAMHSDLNDEITKGIRYRDELERVQIVSEREVRFHGRHAIHRVCRPGDSWVCDCTAYWTIATFIKPGFCRHTMATERKMETDSFLKQMMGAEKMAPALALVSA